jgi:hypothetical protein
MWTTATLAIGYLSTDVTLTDDNWRRGQPFTRLNVLGDRAEDWHTDTAGYFRRGADQVLAEAGYTRTGAWQSRGCGEYTAPITPTSKEPAWN